MPARNRVQTPQQQATPQVEQPYMGEYSALAEQFLKNRGGRKPIHSVGQGFAELANDLGQALIAKSAGQRQQARDDKDISDVALAQRFVSNPNLSRVGVNDALGQERTIANSVFDRPAEPTERYAGAMAQLSDNPRAQIAAGPSVMDLAKQFEPKRDTYQVSDRFGIMRTPASGGAPEVVTPPPAPQRESRLLTPEEEAQQLRMEAAKRAPQAPMTPVEVYQKNFGPLAPGMMPEVLDGAVTPRQIPQPSGPQDPAVIEQKRIEALKAELPAAKNKLMSVSQPLRSLAGQISAAKKDPNTKDVVGPYEGRTGGGVIGMFGGGNATAASRIENIRNVAQSIGLNLQRQGGVAPGSITEREWPKFEAFVANLDPKQEEDAFIGQLDAAEEMAKGLLEAMEADFQTTYAPVLPRVEAPAQISPEDLNSLLNKYAPQ